MLFSSKQNTTCYGVIDKFEKPVCIHKQTSVLGRKLCFIFTVEQAREDIVEVVVFLKVIISRILFCGSRTW